MSRNAGFLNYHGQLAVGNLMKLQECDDPRLINEAQKFTYLLQVN